MHDLVDIFFLRASLLYKTIRKALVSLADKVEKFAKEKNASQMAEKVG